MRMTTWGDFGKRKISFFRNGRVYKVGDVTFIFVGKWNGHPMAVSTNTFSLMNKGYKMPDDTPQEIGDLKGVVKNALKSTEPASISAVSKSATEDFLEEYRKLLGIIGEGPAGADSFWDKFVKCGEEDEEK